MKRNLIISCLLLAFGLLLGHELIPHHHHDVPVHAATSHDHDGEGEHHHHLLDLFFSVLHHVDEGTSVYISNSEGRWSTENFLVQVVSAYSNEKANDSSPLVSFLSLNFTAGCDISHVGETSFLRGPPGS